MKSRNNLMAGLVVLACSLFLVAGSASAHGTGPNTGTATPTSTCVVKSLKSFVAQGEFTEAATVGDIIEVECNPDIYGTGSKMKITASQLYSRCNHDVTWYVANPYKVEEDTVGVTVALDADGNATVALIAGPQCQAGDSLIDAHMEEEPFETFTTSFAVLPPENTLPGLYALPSSQVEDANSSAVATIVEAEFAGGSEKFVRIGSEEFFHRCRVAPHLHWIRENRQESTDTSEVKDVQLDNNGNAFVVLIGDASCAEGASLIEGDLESKPFTSYEEDFTIESPRPTAF